ncbi:hypothetical protein H2248_000937 [Termitomyces sp. 'cryptogamus']|nr:hypothetical protein H2248_000937 [Termitomyces sp. 'cryptogamus']
MSLCHPAAVAARILAGDVLVVCDGQLLRIPPAWLAAHPGGALAILHFVGRDATDEIHAFHSDHTLDLVARYAVARVDVPWQPLAPPVASGWVHSHSQWRNDAAVVPADRPVLDPPPTSLDLDAQARHSHAYRALHKRIVDAGLYNTPYLSGYGPEILRYVLLASLSVCAYRRACFLTSAFFLGLLWHQLVFTAHDLGHRGVTHNWAVDHLLSILVADCIGGLSIGWWIQNHNIHHLVTNHPSHDPDIEHLPFLAISPVFLNSIWSSFYRRTMSFDRVAKTFVALQHNLFYIIMLFGRFNLYVNSYAFLINKAFDTRRAKGGRWAWSLELFGILFFWSWFGRALYGCGSWQTALAYLLVSHAVTSPLHIQIVLSHFSMSTADLGPTESFPHRQLRTTTDVICDDSIAFIHGGLHLQVTHHLFPRLPRHNLKRASILVKQFAQEQGLTYAEFGFVDGNTKVLGVLKGVAEQVKLMGRVAEAEVRERVEKKVA